MAERIITPDVFTKADRERIKLAADPETRQLLEAYEGIAFAADALMQANDEATKARVKIGQWLRRVNFLK